MQAVRRLAGGDPGIIADAGLGIVAAGLTAVAAWGPPGLIGTTIAGPSWLLALLPVLMGAALVVRRREPLLMWTAIWVGIALQSPYTQGHAHVLQYGPDPKTPEPFVFVLFVAAYSLGAHASLRRAAVGLIAAVPVVAEFSHNGGLGLAFSSHGGGPVGVTLAMLQLTAFWLAGVFVCARRQAAFLAARSAALQRKAEQAAATERARIARELHDIVAHHLSVVVLHAAGARAAGGADPQTLEEIEHSGRQALTETRRLFGVLREPDVETGRAPQPGISELPALVGSLRATGLEVSLSIDGDHAALPPAVDVSAYRIVQEALTNVLKHAGPARAEVTVGCADSAVTIEVTDDGPGNPAPQGLTGGQGLAGMRERVALFGGDLRAGPRPGGGFAVCARLPARAAMISVLIADDQDLIRKGLRMLLEAEPDLRVVGEAGDGSQALAQARRLDPDVILMDVRMPVLDGIQATAQFAQGGGRARILMLTTFNLDEYVYHAMKAGASGFLLKDATREQLTGAIRAVCAGDTLLAPAITRSLIEDFCRGPAPGTPAGSAAGGLSEREREVVRLVAAGLSNAEIAARLFLSEATIKSHITRILARLGLRDRVQIAVYAYEHGIVRPGHGNADG